jgi:hypothetical protein
VSQSFIFPSDLHPRSPIDREKQLQPLGLSPSITYLFSNSSSSFLPHPSSVLLASSSLLLPSVEALSVIPTNQQPSKPINQHSPINFSPFLFYKLSTLQFYMRHFVSLPPHISFNFSADLREESEKPKFGEKQKLDF